MCRGTVLLAVGILWFLTGCSAHPLPEDVTGADLPTDIIVRRIRCEAREAIIKNIMSYLRGPHSSAQDKILATKLGTPALPWTAFRDSLFTDRSRDLVKKFQETGIAYDFVFDITEINNLDSTLDFTGIFTRGSVSTGLGGGIDRSRQSTRNLSITDTFIKLITNPDPYYCDPQYLGTEKPLYPITGNIGLAKTINQFINLALYNNLTGSVSDKGQRGPPTMFDKLIFTTKLSGSVSPKLVLIPGGTGLHLIDVGLGLTASRNDVHTLNIALALQKPDAETSDAALQTAKKAALPAIPMALSAAALQVPGTGVTSFLFINVLGSTPSEILAALTLNQAVLRFEFGKPFIPLP